MARGKKKESALTPEEKLAQALVPDWEQPYKVPENWCWAHWGNCGEFTAGNGFKNEYQGFQDLPIPFYKVGSLKYSDSSGYLYDESNTIDEEIRGKLKATIIPVNSVIFAKIGEAIRLNRRSLNAVPCCIDNNLMAFIANESCLYSYAFYWSKGTELYDFTNATTVPAIRKSDLEMIPFPLPPLAEQQRIVDRIEYLFAKLDEAKEKAQSVLDSFETRKAAILHKAFTGELTAKWRAECGVEQDSWQSTKFRDFCLLKRGFDLPASQRVKGDYPLVSSSGVIDCHNTAQVKGPGVVTGRSGTIGKVFYIEGDYWPLNTTLYSEKLFGNDARYVCYYLHTFDFKSFSSSTAVPTLNRNLFLDVMVLVPSVNEQREIVRILDSLLTKEQQAKEAAEAVLEKIDLLKKSILARAFRGELGTNDPSEESALELLKTIL